MPMLLARKTWLSQRHMEMFMRLGLVTLKAMLLGCLMVILSSPAMALTPLRSPEQLAKDEVLFAQASSAITPKAMQCFRMPPRSVLRPFKVRFFLAAAGQRPAQFEILKEEAKPGAARSRPERAAIRAITTCAPYEVPEELRNWGGFWAAVAFR
jgi:hypothetical protein